MDLEPPNCLVCNQNKSLCEPKERSWWCKESWMPDAHGGPGCLTDPHPHTQGLLFHPKKITFIHNKSVPNPCGAWTAHVQHLGVDVCGSEFVLNEPCSSYPTQTCVNTQFSSPRMLLLKPENPKGTAKLILNGVFPPLFQTTHHFINRKPEKRPNTEVFNSLTLN